MGAKIIIYLAVLTALLLTSKTVLGVPANPEPFNLTQPDNSSFQARQVGDERAAHTETLDSYTIVKDETGWWNYAKKDEKGKIISTGKRVGLVKPEKLDLPKHLHPSVTKELISPTEQVVSVLASQVGTKKALVILINFTNVSQDAGHTPAYYENLLFNTSTGTNSMHNYYKEVSYNNINITGDIAGNRWYGSAHNQSFYGKDLDHQNNSHDDYYGAIFRLAREALILADSDINFANYDTNSNGVLNKDEINIIIVHAGCAEENGGCSGWSTDSIWSHQGSIWGSPIGCTDCIDTFLDGKRISRNNSNEDIAGYTMQAESSPLGTFAHEFGHDLGLPDLYDGDGTSYGVGVWDIMASGMWLNSGNTPPHLSAWSKYLLGWVNPIKVTTSLINEQINQSETNDDVYMFLDNPGDSPGNLDWASNGTGTGEYFLVENRRQFGYDVKLPEEGLLIWHIDESRGDNRNESHKLVDLEEADGLNHLDKNDTNGGNSGDEFDPFYNNTREFTNTFNPNSKLYNGSASNVSVTNVSASGYTMTANLNVASSDWQYNRRLNISGTTAGAQTNYQMRLTVYNSTGTDSPGIVYLGGNAKSDFSDLRFTKSDGVTLLDYWIESYTSGVSAVVWVEVDTIPASPNNASIYLYYGNPSATSASSATSTFVFFDDFEDTDFSEWNIGSSATMTSSSDQHYTGAKSLKYSVNLGASPISYHSISQGSYEIVTYIYDPGYGSFLVPCQYMAFARDASPRLYVGIDCLYCSTEKNYYAYFDDNNNRATWGTRSQGWHKLQWIVNGSTTKMYIDDSLIYTSSQTYLDRIGFYMYYWSGNGVGYGYFDAVRVRKYASPEPVWGS